MDLLSVCHEGWWDNADDLGSTDTGTLSEDDILRLASLYATGAPSLVCSGSKAGTAALSDIRTFLRTSLMFILL